MGTPDSIRLIMNKDKPCHCSLCVALRSSETKCSEAKCRCMDGHLVQCLNQNVSIEFGPGSVIDQDLLKGTCENISDHWRWKSCTSSDDSILVGLFRFMVSARGNDVSSSELPGEIPIRWSLSRPVLLTHAIK